MVDLCGECGGSCVDLLPNDCKTPLCQDNVCTIAFGSAGPSYACTPYQYCTSDDDCASGVCSNSANLYQHFGFTELATFQESGSNDALIYEKHQIPKGLASLGSNPEALFKYDAANKINKLPGLTKFAKDMAPIAVQGTGDLTKAMGDQAMRDWEAADAAEQAEIEATSTANDQEQADLTMKYYRQAGHDEETIQEALEINGLGDYYVPPESAAQGGIIGLKHGGMLNFGGREMDLRTGGFVPIGKKERADDVPARLSKNEFVMTADAVRAAGGGDVNKGAQRMYNVMNNLEARA